MTDIGAKRDVIRVCFFIPEFSYGGAQKQCILLLNELQRRDDIELTLVRFRAGAQDHLLNTSRLRTEYVDVRSNFDARSIFKVRKLVIESRADLIVSWIRVCDVYSYFVRMLSPGVRWVMTQRNSRPPDSWLRWVRDILGRRADAIAANSPGGVQWWQARRAKGPVYLVNNIADPRRPAQKPRNLREILYVGRLEPQKNVLTMMKAFSLAARHDEDLRMRVCGDGALRGEMEQITRTDGVAEKVQFLGFRPNAAEWMARTKVLVSLSDHEGMPNVLMEGVQAGASIVASSIPEHIALLGDAYPFLVEEHHDPEQVARVILRALAAPEMTDDLAHARRLLASMDPATVAARYMDIFDAAMSSRAGRCRTLGNK